MNERKKNDSIWEKLLFFPLQMTYPRQRFLISFYKRSWLCLWQSWITKNLAFLNAICNSGSLLSSLQLFCHLALKHELQTGVVWLLLVIVPKEKRLTFLPLISSSCILLSSFFFTTSHGCRHPAACQHFPTALIHLSVSFHFFHQKLFVREKHWPILLCSQKHEKNSRYEVL